MHFLTFDKSGITDSELAVGL
ncbi:Protein of unknown function [Bacillus mobilis]|nr:Protein of unknown function [Bacillus mobilis]